MRGSSSQRSLENAISWKRVEAASNPTAANAPMPPTMRPPTARARLCRELAQVAVARPTEEDDAYASTKITLTVCTRFTSTKSFFTSSMCRVSRALNTEARQAVLGDGVVEGRFVVVEVVAQRRAVAVEIGAREAGGILGVVAVEGVVVDERRVRQQPDVGRDDRNRERDDEEERGEQRAKPMWVSLCRPAATTTAL